MSKLLELFNNSSKFNRLNVLPAQNGTNRTFSARQQSDIDPEIRQGNAVNFISDDNQKEFTVDESKNALSVTGISKAIDANFTKFTDIAMGIYGVRSIDPKLSTYNSQLVQKYLATDLNKQYKTINSTAAGMVLMYPS